MNPNYKQARRRKVMMKNTKWLLSVMLPFLIAACTDNDMKTDMVEMPVYIAIPSAGFTSPTDVGIDGQPAENHETRAPGDPGTDDVFELPQYIYIYMVTTSDGGSDVTYTKFPVNKSDWKLSTAADNANDHFADVAHNGLYVYQGHLTMYMPARRQTGKVYVAACNVELDELTTDVSADRVAEQVTFNCEKLGTNLKNLYSSPYNLKDKDGNYYGTIRDFASNVPHLDIVLYHTATKLDVQWQIDEDCQGVKEWQETNTTDMSSEDAGKVFFSHIEAYNLPTTAPLFMPMNCTTTYGTDTYALPLHKADTEYKGKRYNGRSVIYTIPRRYSGGDYAMGLRMLVNNYTTENADKGHHASIQITRDALTQSDGSSVYAPWLRAFVHVTTDNVGKLVTFNEKRQ